MTEMLCTGCDKVAQFVVPECEDGHDDCLDLMCVVCGAAITFGGFLVNQETELLASTA